MCVTQSHCCTAETGATVQISCTSIKKKTEEKKHLGKSPRSQAFQFCLRTGYVSKISPHLLLIAK